MDMNLFTTEDGASSGYILTSENIALVINDRIFTFNKTKEDICRIEKLINEAERRVNDGDFEF